MRALSLLIPLAAPLLWASAATADVGRAETGYRDNLVSCIMGQRSCNFAALRQSDRDYFRYEKAPRRMTRALAEEIADARLTPVRDVKVSEETLNRWHENDARFELYRSTERALRQGWIPGANEPYRTPPRGWASRTDAWYKSYDVYDEP